MRIADVSDSIHDRYEHRTRAYSGNSFRFIDFGTSQLSYLYTVICSSYFDREDNYVS